MEGPDTAGREHDEDETWRDIVARFDTPRDGGDDGEDAPWPADEDLDSRSFGSRVIKPADPHAAGGPGAAGDPGALGPGAAGDPVASPDDDEGDEHYVPPPAPPLPSLDPGAKVAWLALFGGPAYLIAATAAQWAVPAWAAFCAVAAFVGGFIALVTRLSDDRGDGSDGDDGAVV